ncbi:hypothetical protein [Cellvibrio japonicus]|nr:hypothetical protein [Cellvibrio japonicus]QEI12641.1 hypothetical protein FY117_10670 [Cellvibrio japonicus]QEI16215.1 hypothetical protein FY116_10675 [Cellvibrio japonicus]QEI19793.1 hypothetical protein FY115_10670 [Cellvibrio japonicus]
MTRLLAAILLVFLSQATLACDETCKRTKVETTKNIKYPSYLNLKYCQTTATDFLLNSRKSLQNYRDKQLGTAHRGGARNIRNFVLQRRDWLQECDKYMTDLDMGSLFRQKDTADKIFAAMNEVADELHKIMMRKKNNAEVLELVVAPAAQKFDQLFKLVDDHVIELQKRGLL